MAWTAPATAVTGDIIPASFWNTYGRDNLNALKDVLTGTAQAFGTIFYPTTQVQFNLQYNAGDPYIVFDTNDWLVYTRATNVFGFYIASAAKLLLDGNGKLTGAGFYDSGEVSVLTGNTATVNHGLGARPRFVAVFAHTASGSADSKQTLLPATSALQIPSTGGVTSTQIKVDNSTGSTRYLNFYAML